MKTVARVSSRPVRGAVRGMLRLLPVLALLLAPARPAAADWVDLGGGPTAVRVATAQPDRIVIEARLGGFALEPIAIEGATYYRVGLPGEPCADEVGSPALPRLRRSLAIPGDREMSVRVLDAQWVDLPDLPVAPATPPRERREAATEPVRTFGPVYDQPGPYPTEAAALGEPFILRDVRGVVLDLNALQAFPAQRMVRAYTRLLVEVVDAGPSDRNVLHRAPGSRPVDPQFARLYRDHFLNYSPERYAPVLEAGSLLIISYDPFLPELEPLVEWKLQKGISTTLVGLATAGSTPEEIKAYILQTYQTSDLANVLLVGDAEQMPTFIVETSASDPSYAMLEGADKYPEIFVGRFSAETPEQVATQVVRTIAYERDLGPDATWLARACGVASNEGPGQQGEYDFEHMDLIRQDLLQYGYDEVDQIYQPDGTTAMITAALEAGRGVVNYTGHGTAFGWGAPYSGWEVYDVDDVNALRNAGRLPFIDTVGCQAGRFVGQTCFAEAWMRASQAGEPTGAVAAYMSASNQYWVPPMNAQDEFVDLLVADSMRTTGGLWFNGSCRMMELNGEYGEQMFERWILFGDPSLAVRTCTPQPIAVDHAGAMPLGTLSYSVTVPECAEALCGLYAGGVLYGSALTDVSGHAVIPLDPLPLEPGTLTLTVTAANRVTAQEDVAVVFSPGPHLVVRSAHVADEGGDGQVDAGETVWLSLEVENIGLQGAEQVVGRISTADPHAQILAGEQPFPPIPAGGSAWSEGLIRLEVAPATPDGHLLPLDIELEAQGPLFWDGALTLATHAPVPVAGELIVDDTQGGDADAHLDPGESARLTVHLRNAGTGYLRRAVATLTCAHPLVTLTGAQALLESLPPGGEAVLAPPFELAVDAGYTLPYADLRLELAGPGDARRHLDVPLAVGGFWQPVEISVSGWSHAPVTSGFLDQWYVSAADNHTPGGTRAWKCGTPGGVYADRLDAGLQTPAVELSGFGELRFWMRIDAQASEAYEGKANDGGRVEISLAGAPFVPLMPPGGYPYTTLPNSYHPFPMVSGVFSGHSDWQQVCIDLADLVGTAVFRFRFGSDESVGGEGWIIDDVEISGIGSFAGLPIAPGGTLELALLPGGPSPSSGEVRLQFTLPRSGDVRLDLFDTGGRHVRSLLDGHLAAGLHAVSWQGRDDRGRPVANGRYYARLVAGGDERSLPLLRFR